MAPALQLPPYRKLTDKERRRFQRSTDRFDAYWVSLKRYQEWVLAEEAGLQKEIYKHRVVPAPADQRETNPPGEPLDIYQQRTSWRRSRGQARKEEAAIAGLNAGQYGVVPLMKPFGMNLKRVLGIGGQGVACLFERVEIDGSTRKVVVKGSLHGANDKSVAREVKNMRAMLGANHIIQRLYAKDIEAPRPPRDTDLVEAMRNMGFWTPKDDANEADLARARIDLDQDDGPFALEYMEHGDARNLIVKLSKMQDILLPIKLFKDQDLWEIFHCLFRGVVAMAYPNRWDGRTGPEMIDPTLVDVTQQFEQIPRNAAGQPLGTARGIVHFDLDPLNVMIGGNDSKHQRVPIVKVGDLGISIDFPPERRDDFSYMLETRVKGKWVIYTPEQNSRDWNFIDRPPYLGQEPIAGNYSWATNMYQAAHTMWQIMTGFMPDTPPQPSKMNFTYKGEAISIWTYGGLVVNDTRPEEGYDGFYDRPLRELIAWCMAVKPFERPNMNVLEEMFLQYCSEQWWIDNPEDRLDQKVDIKDILAFSITPPVKVPGP